ncbi:MAG TPA: peptidylprolyl isomerase [Acetobacteraceae bacterium]|nr:peptidylprolyl isomerase [Acetobacteraceae bacterium]
MPSNVCAGAVLRRLLPLGLAATLLAAAPAPRRVPGQPIQPVQAIRIVAVVNGEAVTNDDVDNRARLFALATNLPVSADMLNRLKPQIIRQLVDERLRMQEVKRLKIVVPDKEIAAAVAEIEQRNGMQPGGLRNKLQSDGVSFTTLVDQVRTQLGWNQVLRQKLGERMKISDAEVAERQRLEALQVGKPQYHVGEIFIPIENQSNATDAQRFAETVISELRKGAPFAVMAAQFSQNRAALAGGDLGWVELNQLDPPVAQVVGEMPPGAISNPIAVPGGLDIVALVAKREFGRDPATMLSIRQVFLPFPGALNPQAPTPAQMQVFEKAKGISASVHSCEQMAQVAADNHSPRPADPGEIRLESVTPPAFREILDKLPLQTPTRPLVSNDGVAVMIICSRDQKNMAELSPKDIKEQILGQRVDLLSRQLQQDLRSQGRIEMRGGGTA